MSSVGSGAHFSGDAYVVEKEGSIENIEDLF
jgi:hypothetical protein